MSELVMLHHNEPMTTSLAIADGVQLQHKNVVSLIRKHAEALLSFGSLAFETRVMRQDGRGGELGDVYFLNEPQSTLLITFMRNSEIVIAFKIALVKAFFELRDRVKTIQPAFTTTNLSHGADLAVAADRTFRGFLRSARSAGLRLPQALKVANQQTISRTGMDMLAELGVDPAESESSISTLQDSIDRFLSAWLRGETRYPRTPCRSSDLFSAYRQWCGEMDERFQPDAEFHKRSARFPGIRKSIVRVDDRNARVAIPDCETPPDGWSVSRWVARCVDGFAKSI